MLGLLGCAGLFGQVFCFESFAPGALSPEEAGVASAPGPDRRKVVCKPWPAAFQITLSRLGVADPRKACFLDDNARNCRGAKALGIFTVLVGGKGHDPEVSDVTIGSILELPEALPQLFAAEPEGGAGAGAEAGR